MMHNPLNRLIMEEIGLSVNDHKTVIDQDTREILKFRDKNIKYSSTDNISTTRNDILFDAIETRNLMRSLFDHFTKKIEMETGLCISVYHDIKGENDTTSLRAIVYNKNEDDSFNTISSDYYKLDALRYLDVIIQLNDSDRSILKKYDIF